jgi:hypothetical protein
LTTSLFRSVSPWGSSRYYATACRCAACRSFLLGQSLSSHDVSPRWPFDQACVRITQFDHRIQNRCKLSQRTENATIADVSNLEGYELTRHFGVPPKCRNKPNCVYGAVLVILALGATGLNCQSDSVHSGRLSPVRFFQLLLSMSLRRSFLIKTKFSVRLRFTTSCTEPSVSRGITC